MADLEYVATEALLRGRLSQLGCVPEGKSITATRYRTPCGKIIFIPAPLGGIGYTQAQLSAIENTLAYYELELLPMDQAATISE